MLNNHNIIKLLRANLFYRDTGAQQAIFGSRAIALGPGLEGPDSAVITLSRRLSSKRLSFIIAHSQISPIFTLATITLIFSFRQPSSVVKQFFRCWIRHLLPPLLVTFRKSDMKLTWPFLTWRSSLSSGSCQRPDLLLSHLRCHISLGLLGRRFLITLFPFYGMNYVGHCFLLCFLFQVFYRKYVFLVFFGNPSRQTPDLVLKL